MTLPAPEPELFDLLTCEDCRLVLWVGERGAIGYRQCWCCDRMLKPKDRITGPIDTLIQHARRHSLRASSTEMQRIFAPWTVPEAR